MSSSDDEPDEPGTAAWKSTHGARYVTTRERAAALIGRPLMAANSVPRQFEMDNMETNGIRQFIVLSGKRRTGKSWWIRDYLYTYRHVFSYGYIFAHTKFNAFYQKFFPNHLIISEFSPEIMYEIFEIQKNRVTKRGESTEIFIVFDDIISDSSMRYQDMVTRLATEGRHYNITVLFSTQYYKGIGPMLRLNADKFVLFTTTSRLVIQAVQEEFGFADFVDEANFMAFLEKNTEDNQTVVIDLKDTTLRGEERWSVYKARDLGNVKFSLLCDRAWRFKRHETLAAQRKLWNLPDPYALSTYKRYRSKARITADEARGNTDVGEAADDIDPFGHID